MLSGSHCVLRAGRANVKGWISWRQMHLYLKLKGVYFGDLWWELKLAESDFLRDKWVKVGSPFPKREGESQKSG